MAMPTSLLGSRAFTLPDMRRRPGWSLSTDRQDPTKTVAARSGSDPATAYVLYIYIYIYYICIYIYQYIYISIYIYIYIYIYIKQFILFKNILFFADKRIKEASKAPAKT